MKCADERVQALLSIDKVRIGAVLSVLHEEDPRLGPAARANVFDFAAPEFDQLRQFLYAMGMPAAAS